MPVLHSLRRAHGWMNHLSWCNKVSVSSVASSKVCMSLRGRIVDTVILSPSRILPMTVDCLETCLSLLVSTIGLYGHPEKSSPVF